jgi:hypothetical protein
VQLYNTDRGSVFAATSVCKAWHALAQRIIDASVGPIAIGPSSAMRNLKLFERLEADAEYRSRVRHMSVRDWDLDELALTGYHRPDHDPLVEGEYFSRTWTGHDHDDATWPQIDALADVLSSGLSLLSFSWSAAPSIPESLGLALKTMPACKILIEANPYAEELVTFSLRPYANFQSLASLGVISKQLSSLHVLLPAASDELLAELPSLIWSSPSLRDLQIHAAGYLWVKAYVPDALKETAWASFITVRNLEWLRRPGQAPQDQRLRFSRLDLRNICMCDKLEDAKILDAVDWSCLEHLSTTCVGLLREIVSRSNRISQLKIVLNSGRKCEYAMCSTQYPQSEVKRILVSLQSLKHLEITNGTSIVDDELLNGIGHGLHTLSLHEVVGYHWPIPIASFRPVLANSLLSLMRFSCPLLENLELDVPYSDEEASACCVQPRLMHTN